jgi:hypothetical protein
MAIYQRANRGAVFEATQGRAPVLFQRILATVEARVFVLMVQTKLSILPRAIAAHVDSVFGLIKRKHFTSQ